MTTRQAQRVYLEAARMIAEGEEEFSCWAVDNVAHRDASPHHSCRALVRGYIWVIFGRRTTSLINITQDERVLALCLMAVAYPDLKKQGVFDE